MMKQKTVEVSGTTYSFERQSANEIKLTIRGNGRIIINTLTPAQCWTLGDVFIATGNKADE